MHVFQHIDLSRAGAFAIVRRYGDTVRLRNFLRVEDRQRSPSGQRAPTGNADIDPQWMYGPRGLHILDVMARLRTIPMGYAALEVCVVEPEPGRYREVGVPVADDLGADGVCRCGCGSRAPEAP